MGKAREQFAGDHGTHERIRAIDDEVLFKVKIQRWRGAVWLDEDQPWLVAAGQREDGSADDFYAALEADANAARARHNSEHSKPLPGKTYVGPLLPTADDYARHRLEAGIRLVRRLVAELQDLTRGSLRDGHEHATDFPTFRLGVLVRADEGHETYVAVRITGSVPDDLAVVILRHVPGCDPQSWFPEYALPGRHLLPAEQAWSTVMEPQAAARLLEGG
ncbi:hypothetical protein OG455_25645 [Kitasatospora sp. NBC_01287]|uniref:hypothetical protein n=1 Tax=Kitasatospora sp. NBC_01287 TaxID=2903573 RepID=UPI002250BCBD|nr:hypothetical protein [Kitasatospora sp. NBC_01287]MCX4748858.1 hypothetical protein [Kitasatospora sp. NBC_01287]